MYTKSQLDSTSITRLSDGATIPFDKSNQDFQEFCEWCRKNKTTAEKWLASHSSSIKNRTETIPPVITMRQARLALLKNGFLSGVEEFIKKSKNDQLKIEWGYSTQVHRDNQLVTLVGKEFKLDQKALDQLFIQASTL